MRLGVSATHTTGTRRRTRMKHLKMLGLAVVAAAAFMAVIGAGMASATELCSTATTPCSGTKYSSTTINAMLVPATWTTFTTSITTVTCTSSTIKAKTTSAGGAGATAVTGESTAFEFTGCTRTGGESCTVKSTNLGNVSISGGSASETAKFDYNITTKTGAHVECGFFINCTFSVLSALLPSRNQVAGMPIIRPENLALAKEGGLCPESATWNGTYEATEPTQLFVV
jgi:hypothetical protein